MQPIRQILEALEAGVCEDTIFMQLHEGVNKSTANTIGVEIEMSLEQKDSGPNDAAGGISATEASNFEAFYSVLIDGLNWIMANFPLQIINIAAKDNSARKKINEWVRKNFTNLFQVVNNPSSIKSDLERRKDKYKLVAPESKLQLIQNFSNLLFDVPEIFLEIRNGIDNLDLDEFQKALIFVTTESKKILQFITDNNITEDTFSLPVSKSYYEIFDSEFKKIGWSTKIDASIRPRGKEAVSGIIPIADFGAINAGFEAAKKLLQQGWSFNASTGVHFHLGTNKDVDAFYILAMVVLFSAKEDMIYKYFPDRRKSSFAKSMQSTVASVLSRIEGIYRDAEQDTENRVELTDEELKKALTPLNKTGSKGRYFGVNAVPSLKKHGTIELRYFHGQKFIDEPTLLPKLIALFRSIMHEAQTSSYLPLGNMYIERTPIGRIYVHKRRPGKTNKRLPLKAGYIPIPLKQFKISRKDIPSDEINDRRKQFRLNKISEIASEFLSLLKTTTEFLKNKPEHISEEDANRFSKLCSELKNRIDRDELHRVLQSVIHPSDYVRLMKVLRQLSFTTTEELVDHLVDLQKILQDVEDKLKKVSA